MIDLLGCQHAVRDYEGFRRREVRELPTQPWSAASCATPSVNRNERAPLSIFDSHTDFTRRKQVMNHLLKIGIYTIF